MVNWIYTSLPILATVLPSTVAILLMGLVVKRISVLRTSVKLGVANVNHCNDVRAVVLESTGDGSVIHTNSDKILKGVGLQ